MEEEFDVFVSHKKEDLTTARQLARKIEKLGYRCYLDAKDRKLSQAKQASDALQAIPEHLRATLRQCRSLIFVSSPNSAASRWMPWETGFFDGRYDKSAIGIYLTEAIPANGAVSTIQEYLNLYTTLTDDNLADFLALTSNRTKMNVREGQIDQLMLSIRTATENPREFSIGCLQWGVGYWRSLIAQMYGEALANAWLPGMESMLGKLRGEAAVEDFAARVRQQTSGPQFTFPSQLNVLDMIQKAHGDAAKVSVV